MLPAKMEERRSVTSRYHGSKFSGPLNSKAPFILRSLKWDRSEIDLKSVLRSVRDRMRTCSHWRLLIRQIIPNLGGLSSLFTLWLRVRWVAWHRLAFFVGRFLRLRVQIFSILARDPIILAGKRDSRRHSSTSFRENVVVAEKSNKVLEVLSSCGREMA